MATSLIPGMSDAQWDILMGAAQSSRNDIATTGSIQPATPIPTPQAGSTTKTPTQYVPYISANKDPNGGNTTEYRAPRAGDTGIGVTVPTPTPTPTPTVNTPQPTVPTGLYQDPYARSREDIAKLAADRIAKILQAGKTSAQGALTGAKNAYDYTNTIQGDNRTLRNASLKESANPFGGSFGYQAATNNRNDSIQDTAQDKDYNAQVAQINQKLADLEAAAPGDEQAIIDQLEQIERQTGISVAQLQEQQKNNQANYTGMYGGQQTIQSKAQDAEYTGMYNGQKTASQANADRTYDLQIRQQHIKEAQDLSDKYGITVEPKDNYSLVLDQIRGLKTTNQQDAASKAKSEKEKAAWDKIETLGYVPPDVAELVGLPAYTQTQTAKNQAAQNAISSRNATTAENNSTNSANNSSLNQLMDIWKATGKAPVGIPNVVAGTPYAGQTSNTPTPTELNNQYVADVVTNVDKMTPENRKSFFTNEKAALIKKLGKSGYDNLYNDYFNADGTLKSG